MGILENYFFLLTTMTLPSPTCSVHTWKRSGRKKNSRCITTQPPTGTGQMVPKSFPDQLEGRPLAFTEEKRGYHTALFFVLG